MGILLVSMGWVQEAYVTVEAESGLPGADFAVSNSSSPTYITITSNCKGNNLRELAVLLKKLGMATFYLYKSLNINDHF